jgi:hypothetical protein
LYDCVVSFKSPSFREECEWRIVFSLPETLRRVNGQSLRFRSNWGGLVPYHVLDFNRENSSKASLPLLTITYGPTPHPELAQRAIIHLLESRGYSKEIEVICSTIPLRV